MNPIPSSLGLVLLRAAKDSLGIYPAAVTRGNERHERTEWQEGWNACYCRMTENHAALRRWWDALADTTRLCLTTLLEAQAIDLRCDGHDVALSCNVSDTFLWGCADREEVTEEDLPLLLTLWKHSGDTGLLAWATHRRGMEPMASLCTPAYHAAYAFAALLGIARNPEYTATDEEPQP